MKKTFKRIIALAIVLCTLGAMMIPGVSVSAEETPANLDVSFVTDIKTTAGCTTTNQNLDASDAQREPINSLYPDTLKWCFYMNGTTYPTTNSTSKAYSTTGTLSINSSNKSDNVGKFGYTPLKFVAPGTGEYKLSLTESRYKWAGLTDFRVVILEIPEGGYTAATLRDAADAATTLLQFNPTGRNKDASGFYDEVTHTSDICVDLVEGQEYILALGAYCSKTGEETDCFSGFSLTYVQRYDYSVTYNANYGSVAPVADNENVTKSDDTEKVITLDAPFSRSGYLFMGWATEAEGAVVYQPGDEITLTSDAPTRDLYAVWLAQSNDSFTLDFQAAKDDLGVAQGDNTSGIIITGQTPTANGNIIVNAYNAGTYNWAPYTVQNNYGNYIRHTSNGLKIANRNLAAGSVNRGGVVLNMRAPESGKFTVSASILGRPGDNISDSVEIHIMPKPNYLLDGYDQRYTLQGFITQRTAFTDNDGNRFTFNEEDAIINTTVQDNSLSSSAVKNVKGKEYVFEAGKEYIIVIALCETDASITRQQDALTAAGSKSKPSCTAEILNMSFTPVLPEATIGSASYATVEGAVAAAVSGNTIVLNADAEAESINLPLGVTLNLNGKTLTTGAIAGTVADSTDGKGLIVVEQGAAVIEGAANQLALWDNTTGAEGYRVFGYTFNSLNVTGTDNKDLYINFVDDYTKFFKKSTIILNGYTKYAAGETVNAAYEAGTNDWAIAAGHRMGIGNVELMSNGLKIAGRTLGADNAARVGAFGLKIQSPGSGYYKPSIRYVARPGVDVAEDLAMYIMPMPEVGWTVNANGLNEMTSGYAFNSLFQTNPPSAFGVEPTKLLATSVRDTTMTATNDTRTAVGEPYYFEEGVDYMIILVVDSAVYATPTAEVLSMSFKCVQSDTTFWSDLEFTNDAAYALVPNSGLTTGFKMSTMEAPVLDEESNWEDFRLPADVVGAWAGAEANPEDETNYGFYICVRGFESLKADTTVTCVPYVKVGNQTVYANAKTYEHKVPVAE